MTSNLSKLPGIELISKEEKYDPRTQNGYCETKWSYNGHEVDVNIDEYGYHPRIDGNDCPGAKSEGGLIGWLLDVLGVDR